jgi:hypothetical protein
MKKILSVIAITLFAMTTTLAQNGYTKQQFQLPFSSQVKEYYVKLIGNNYILNGDIIVGDNLPRTMAYNRQASGGWSYIWPKGYIPIRIDASVNNKQSLSGQSIYSNIVQAIDYYNEKTMAKMRPHTTEQDYIRIKYSPDTSFGGLSAVGRQGGEQILWISPASGISEVLHELMHAIGFWHEQNRFDRDTYVQIQTDNILPGWEYAFQLEDGNASGPYDKSSLMHYRSNAFSKNKKPTIKCSHNGGWEECNTGNNFFSEDDIKAINSNYFFNASLPNLRYKDELERILNAKGMSSSQVNNKDLSVRVKDQLSSPIETGKYKIKINQTGKYLAIENVSKENGARLVQWDYFEQSNHQFYVRKLGDGFYTIAAVHSNRYLNTSGQSKADGTPIIQWDYAGEENGRWYLWYTADDNGNHNPGWVIQNKNSGTPIRLSGSAVNKNNGEPFVLFQSQRIDANQYELTQTFTFERIGDLPWSEKQMEKRAIPKSGGVIIKKNN